MEKEKNVLAIALAESIENLSRQDVGRKYTVLLRSDDPLRKSSNPPTSSHTIPPIYFVQGIGKLLTHLPYDAESAAVLTKALERVVKKHGYLEDPEVRKALNHLRDPLNHGSQESLHAGLYGLFSRITNHIPLGFMPHVTCNKLNMYTDEHIVSAKLIMGLVPLLKERLEPDTVGTYDNIIVLLRDLDEARLAIQQAA